MVETREHNIASELFDLWLGYVVLSALVYERSDKAIVDYAKIDLVEDICIRVLKVLYIIWWIEV